MSIYTPANQFQGTPADADGWKSCGAYSSAVLVDAVSLGGCVMSGHQFRLLTDEPQADPHDPGLTIPQLVRAAARFGCKLEDRTGMRRPQAKADLMQGRYLSVSVWYPLMGAYRSQKTGEFGHQMAVGRLNTTTGQVMLFDPLNRSTKGRWMPSDILFAAMEEWGRRTGLGRGQQMRYARTRAIPALA